MPYVIDYEIGALLVLITVFVRFLPFRRSVDLSRTLFVWLISVALLDLSADILGTLAIAAIEQLPFALTLGVNLFFYLTQATLPMLMMTFVGYISGAFHRRFRKFLPLYLPFLSALVLIFTNPLHHFLAQIVGAPGSYSYVSGIGIPILYGICFYHLLVAGAFACASARIWNRVSARPCCFAVSRSFPASDCRSSCRAIFSPVRPSRCPFS